MLDFMDGGLVAMQRLLLSQGTMTNRVVRLLRVCLSVLRALDVLRGGLRIQGSGLKLGLPVISGCKVSISGGGYYEMHRSSGRA